MEAKLETDDRSRRPRRGDAPFPPPLAALYGLTHRLNALDGVFERRPTGRRFLFGFSPGGCQPSIRNNRAVRGKTPEDHSLLELLDPVAEAAGYEIVRLRMKGGEQ